MDVSKIHVWKQVSALAISASVTMGLEITIATDEQSRLLVTILAIMQIGLAAYIVKRDYDNKEKDSSRDNMLSNLASITELKERLRDKIIVVEDEVKEKLRFTIDEITQYGDDLTKRYRDDNNN